MIRYCGRRRALGLCSLFLQARISPDEPSFYAHAPSRVDPAAAPAGQDTLLALASVGHIDDGAGQDWEALRSRARSAVLRRPAGIGVTDLEQHIKFEVGYTPPSAF